MSINPITFRGAPSTSRRGCTSAIIQYWRGRVEGALAEGGGSNMVPWIRLEHYFSNSLGNQFVLLGRKNYDLSEEGEGWRDLYGTLWQLMFVANHAAYVGGNVIFTPVRGSVGGGPFSPDEGVKVLCGLLEVGKDAVKDILEGENDLKQKALENMGVAMDFLRYVFGQIIDVS